MSNQKYKLIALFGESGSGKDFALKELLQTSFGQENLFRVVSYTTRPMRKGEEAGVNYHFLPAAADFFATKVSSRRYPVTKSFTPLVNQPFSLTFFSPFSFTSLI